MGGNDAVREVNAPGISRISTARMTDGAVQFFRDKILPHLSENRTVFVMASAAAEYLRKSPAAQEKVLGNPLLRTMLDYDEASGTWNPDTILAHVENAVKDGGTFPLKIQLPKIPFINLGADEINLSLRAEDITALRRDLCGENFMYS